MKIRSRKGAPQQFQKKGPKQGECTRGNLRNTREMSDRQVEGREGGSESVTLFIPHIQNPLSDI